MSDSGAQTPTGPAASSGPANPHAPDDDHRIAEIVRGGPKGTIVVAGIATFIVFAIWFAFYFLVFLPRGVLQ